MLANLFFLENAERKYRAVKGIGVHISDKCLFLLNDYLKGSFDIAVSDASDAFVLHGDNIS